LRWRGFAFAVVAAALPAPFLVVFALALFIPLRTARPATFGFDDDAAG